jgi:hypothetical protein
MLTACAWLLGPQAVRSLTSSYWQRSILQRARESLFPSHRADTAAPSGAFPQHTAAEK